VLIAVCSVKGSPGATSLVVALAARWPQPQRPLVVEVDPAGGDLGSRWSLHDEPGLRSLVTSSRYGPLADPTGWSQHLPIGVDVVICPPDPTAASTIEAFEHGPATLLEVAASRPVLVDVGRIGVGSPALPFLDKADRTLLVSRPGLEDARHAAGVLPMLRERCAAVQLVLIGNGPYPSAEFGAYLGIEVAGVIGHDQAGADVVGGRRRPATGWTRRRLLAGARTLALTLTDAVPDDVRPNADSGRPTPVRVPA
jgi:hypothetical protein